MAVNMPLDRAAREAPLPSDPLERATDGLIDAFAADLDADGEEVLRREADVVVEGLRSILEGHAPEPPGPDASDRLRLLRALRTEVLRHWAPDDGPLLSLMLAFDMFETNLLEWSGHATVGDLLNPMSRKLLREVAHALRSPLGSMVARADALRDEGAGPLSDVQKQQLAIIYRAALTAATMAGDVLTLVDEEERFETSRFSLGETVDSVANLMRPVTEARNCELTVSLQDGSLRIGPASAVGQALLTLGLRAALMTRDGHIDLTVAPNGDDTMEFSVTTDGVDVESEADAEEQLRALRRDPYTDSFTMSTNGLAIEAARETIRRMGSELHLAPTSNGALRMSFELSMPAAR